MPKAANDWFFDGFVTDERISQQPKRRKLDLEDIARTALVIAFADKIPKIDYYLMSGCSVEDSLNKLENQVFFSLHIL